MASHSVTVNNYVPGGSLNEARLLMILAVPCDQTDTLVRPTSVFELHMSSFLQLAGGLS